MLQHLTYPIITNYHNACYHTTSSNTTITTQLSQYTHSRAIYSCNRPQFAQQKKEKRGIVDPSFIIYRVEDAHEGYGVCDDNPILGPSVSTDIGRVDNGNESY